MATLVRPASWYQRIFQALLPRGAVWPRDPDTVQAQVCAALMQTPAREDAAAAALLADSFPATTNQLLPEWEATLGLPDPCAGESPTLEQRRNQVVARLTSGGGQSVAYMVGYAANLGFAVTVRQFVPFRLGRARLGTPLNGAPWANVWAIQAPQTTITSFRLGDSRVGEPFRAWGNAVLECELRAISPAHTILQFQYV